MSVQAPSTSPEPAGSNPDSPLAATGKGDHVFLIDGSGYIFRAYHALPPLNRKSDGVQLNAVFGFCNMLWKLLRDMDPKDKPTHLAVVFDKSEKTFRTDMYPAYKAHRPDPPSDLIPQFALIREAVRAFDVPCVEQAGFEADDLIATYAREACERGARASIVSSDKDLMQLVTDCVIMYDTMKDKKIGIAEVIEKFGVPPEKVIEVQSLIGDSTDNVPGVPGIGPKAAATLINELGTLDSLLEGDPTAEQIDVVLTARLQELDAKLLDIAGEPVKASSGTQVARILQEKFGVLNLPKDKKGLPTVDTAKIEELSSQGNEFCNVVMRVRNLSRLIGSATKKIAENREKAKISRKLVTLDQHVALDVPLADLAVHEPDYRRLVAFLKAMEFTTLTRRVAEFSGVEAAEIEAVASLSGGARTGPATASPEKPAAFDTDGGSQPPSRTKARKSDRSDTSDLFPSTVPAPPLPAEGSRPPRSADRGSQPTIIPSALAEARAEKLRAIPVDRTRYEVVRDLDRLNAWVQRGLNVGVVAFDTQATSIDPMQATLYGLSLAVAPNEACYIPLSHRQQGDGGSDGLFAGGIAPDQIPEAAALEALRPLLEDKGVLKVGQNLKSDLQMLALRGITVAPHDDITLMSYVLDAGRYDHALEALAKRCFNHTTIDIADLVKSGKLKITFDSVEVAKAAEYAAEDADMTLRLWLLLKPRLVAERMVSVYETLERPLVPVLARMERHGISIDRQTLARLSGEFAQRATALEAEIQVLAGEPLNPGSPKQLGDILFGKFGLPGGTKTKTGAWSTGARALEELAEQGHELPRRILDWRQVAKLRSTYTDALPGYVNPTTHRVHTSYALAATTTGRLSSSEPNLQNIPIRTEEGRKIRRAFVATEGTKLASADYSQIELRLLAEIADIAPLKTAFRDGLDIHAMTASEMFGVPIAGMPGDIRRRAKAINFGIIYGISAFGLANQLSIAREEAGAYIKKYFERFPGIRDYMEETKAFCKTNGYVLTLFGRKCHYPDIKHSNPSIRSFNERAAINARLQGTAADIIRRAMVHMDAALVRNGLNARMLLQVHDELVFEVPEGEVEKTLPVVRTVMENAPMPAVALSVPLAVDARAAHNWDEAH